MTENTNSRPDIGRPPEESLFERKLDHTTGDTRGYRDAVIEVCDTAEFALRWLKDFDLRPTAADVVALTDIIIRQRNEKRREANRGTALDD